MYPSLYEKSNCFGILGLRMNIVLFDGDPFFPPQDNRYQHIKKILKKKAGDTFTAGIINGQEGLATIVRFDETGLYFDFHGDRAMKPLYPLILIIGFPRPIQLKRLLRDAASLGVSSIYLIGTELGEKSYRESSLVGRGAANESLIEGCSQAGGSAIPDLEMFDSVRSVLDAVAATFPTTDQCILLDTQNQECQLMDAPFFGISENHPLFLAIGSERGWTASERALFRIAGFRVCSIGERILRTETASAVATGIALAKLQQRT